MTSLRHYDVIKWELMKNLMTYLRRRHLVGVLRDIPGYNLRGGNNIVMYDDHSTQPQGVILGEIRNCDAYPTFVTASGLNERYMLATHRCAGFSRQLNALWEKEDERRITI